MRTYLVSRGVDVLGRGLVAILMPRRGFLPDLICRPQLDVGVDQVVPYAIVTGSIIGRKGVTVVVMTYESTTLLRT